MRESQFGPCEYPDIDTPKPSRPVRRCRERAEAFVAMTKQAPGENRKIRRAMAFDRLRREHQHNRDRALRMAVAV